MSKNHYHLTVKCTAKELETLANKIKAKPTSIDLHTNTDIQTDRMLTKYHRDLSSLKVKANKDIQTLNSLGYEVLRLKIEEVVESFTEQDVGNYHYLEGHIKVKSTTDLKPIDGFILSRNNTKSNTRFYNFRVRTAEDYNKVFSNIHLINNEIEREFERVIYDSNEKHDRWWG